jgi:hypothetical protein
LNWAQVQGLADDALEARLDGLSEAAGTRHRPTPDCVYLHAERRKPGVTLELEMAPEYEDYRRLRDEIRRAAAETGTAADGPIAR